jgi:hypothetical protein
MSVSSEFKTGSKVPEKEQDAKFTGCKLHGSVTRDTQWDRGYVGEASMNTMVTKDEIIPHKSPRTNMQLQE